MFAGRRERSGSAVDTAIYSTKVIPKAQCTAVHCGRFMKRYATASISIAIVGSISLTGCGVVQLRDVEGQAPTTSSPTPTAQVSLDPNAPVCYAFTELSEQLEPAIMAGTMTQAQSSDFGAEVDRIGLLAEGTVRDRILALTEDWPSLGDLIYGDKATEFLDDWAGALRACSADLGI